MSPSTMSDSVSTTPDSPAKGAAVFLDTVIQLPITQSGSEYPAQLFVDQGIWFIGRILPEGHIVPTEKNCGSAGNGSGAAAASVAAAVQHPEPGSGASQKICKAPGVFFREGAPGYFSVHIVILTGGIGDSLQSLRIHRPGGADQRPRAGKRPGGSKSIQPLDGTNANLQGVSPFF